MKDFEIWRRFTSSQTPNKPQSADLRFYVPPVEPVGGLPYELAGLLPNRDHNRDLMTLINDLPENKSGSRAMVGIFAADPFLNSRQIASRLLAKGYSHVVNSPPVGGYGTEFLTTLDNVHSGRAGEMSAMEQLAGLGLTVCPVVSSAECISDVLTFSPPLLWVAPGFDMWKSGAIDSERLLSLCRESAEQSGAKIILMTAGTGISKEDAKKAGAGGVLVN